MTITDNLISINSIKMGCCHKLCPFTSNSHKASLSEKLIDISRPEEDYWSSKVTFDDFQPIAVLGRGSYGKVILVRKKNEDKLYAMKILKKNHVKLKNQVENTKSERAILEKIKHPFIFFDSIKYKPF